MSASVSDKLRRGAPAFSTTLAAQKLISAASMSLSSTTGVPTDTGIDITVGRVDVNGVKTPSLKAVYKATLSGTTASNLTLVEGTDQTHAAGTPVEITFTAATWNDMINWALTQHTQSGAHTGITTDTLTVTSGTTLPAGDIATADIADGAVTAVKTTGIWWSELGRTTLASAGDTLTASFTAKKYLKFVVNIKAVNVVNIALTFNGDTGANYGYTYHQLAQASTTDNIVNTSTSRNNVGLVGNNLANNDLFQANFEINNVASLAKMFTGLAHLSGQAATNYSITTNFWGHWANTSSQINSVTLTNPQTGDFAIGSELVVLGHD